MAKAKNSNRSAKNPIRVIFDWFLAPRRKSAFATEDRGSKSRRKSGQGPAKVAGRKGTTGPSAGKQGDSAWAGVASVDKRGQVRFEGDSRVLHKSTKGSKAAALDEAATLFTAQVSDLEGLEVGLGASAYDRDAIAAFLKRFRATPGLAPSPQDLDKALVRADGLETQLHEILEGNRKARLAIISQLEASKNMGFSEMQASISDTRNEWQNAGDIESVHLASLDKRFENAVASVEGRLAQVCSDPGLILTERSEILDAYAELMAEETEAKNLDGALASLKSIWQSTTGVEQVTELSAADDQRYASQSTQQSEVHLALTKLAAVRQQDLVDVATVSRIFLAGLIQKLENHDPAARRELADLDEQVQSAIAGIRPVATREDQTQIASAQSALNAAFQAVDTQNVAREQKAKDAAAQVKTIQDELNALSPSPEVTRSWSHFEEQKAALLDKLRGLHTALGRREQNELDAFVKAFGASWSQTRSGFFEKLDASREASEAKKVNLIDRLTHYPEGMSVQEIDALLKSSMEEWKAIGPAERDREEELWQEFSEVRKSIAQELAGLREDAKGERQENLAVAFARKRERLVWLEWLANHDRYLARQKDMPSLAKDWASKEREIAKLQRQLFDIQRKLNKASPLRAKAATPND